MNWNEIVEKQGREYKEHLEGYKANLDKSNAEQAKVMQHMKCNSEAELPEPMRVILKSNREAWQNEWGMYGQRFKNMRVAHQKEIDKYFRAQEITKSLDKRDKSKEAER
jgi:hypothetical protein